MTQFIYLHGFASGPSSKKAVVFKNKFKEIGFSLVVPDLEKGNFENINLTFQMNILFDLLDINKDEKVCLVGSSMGGYLAVIAAQKRTNVKAIYLMAPGFNFMDRWMKKLDLDCEDETSWISMIPVFHYRYGTTKLISTHIFKDAKNWNNLNLDREIPIRIVHGIHDEVVSVNESRNFIIDRPWASLKELDADHSLLSHVDWIVTDSIKFFNNFKFI
jgi:esterase/lipase